MTLINSAPPDFIPAAGKVALFADFDGTLVEVAPTPDSVVVPAVTWDLLSDLKRKTSGALAIITGRRIDDLDRHLAPLILASSGCLGAEVRLNPEEGIHVLAEPMPPEMVRRLRSLACQIGAFFEDKIYAVCLHYGDVLPMRTILEAELPGAVGEAARNLDVRFTKHSCEIKQHRLNKGDAVKKLLAMPEFKGRTPVYIGDSALDREAFLTVRAADGIAVCVGDECEFTEADFHLRSVRDVHNWLEKI